MTTQFKKLHLIHFVILLFFFVALTLSAIFMITDSTDMSAWKKPSGTFAVEPHATSISDGIAAIEWATDEEYTTAVTTYTYDNFATESETFAFEHIGTDENGNTIYTSRIPVSFQGAHFQIRMTHPEKNHVLISSIINIHQ